MNTLILINLQKREHTYLYYSVRSKKKIKLESNYETKERSKKFFNGLGN